MSEAKKIYILFFSFLLLILGSGGGGSYFLIKKIQTLSKEYQQVLKEANEVQEKIRYFQHKKEVLKEKEKEVEKLEKMILDPEKVVDFISWLENLAKETNLSLQIVSAQPSLEEGYLTFNLSLVGNFSDFFKFFTGIFDSPFDKKYFIKVEKVDIRKIEKEKIQRRNIPGSASSKKGSMEAKIELKVFSKKVTKNKTK